MKRIVLLVIIFTSVVLKSFSQDNTELPIYKDSTKDIEQRVEDLIPRMTLEEKVVMLGGVDIYNTKENKRLGIPTIIAYDYKSAIVAGRKTINYSSTINWAATFNEPLIKEVGVSLGEEARIIGSNWILNPCINILRNPLNGRGFESLTEDPYLNSRISVAYVLGVQSQNVIACPKHFVANNQEWNRFDVDVQVDERTLREIYYPAFKATVQEGGAWSIMSAYNSLNGDYTAENNNLLNDVLKQEWGFDGFVVSDWGGTHSTVKMAKAGLDLEMEVAKFYGDKLLDAVKNGDVDESIVDDKVKRLVRTMLKAGLFDESPIAYGGIANTPERNALALKVAEQSIVLLKNTSPFGQETNILPLDKSKLRSIAVIGPNGNVARVAGAGSGAYHGYYQISPLEGIKNKLDENIDIQFERGIPARADKAPVVGPEYFTTKDGKPGIYAEYYNNKEQEGEPVYTTIEKDVNFNWGWGTPKQGVVNLEEWSAKFTGKFKSPGEGWYEIGLRSDNGVRIHIDGVKVLDAWIGSIAGKFNSTRYKFEKGRTYDIQIDFFENLGGAQCQLGLTPFNADAEIKKAVDLASKSDVVILALGLDPVDEGESVDRVRLGLDGDQLKLLYSVVKANKNTVVVLNNGTPISMEGWLDKVPAVIDAFYPGQDGGTALANILFGDVNPSGKLPITFPKKMEDTPVANNYPGKREVAYYTEGIFVGYRWFDRKDIEPLFPFGFGLSYTTFEFSDLKLSKSTLTEVDQLTIEVTVKNTGKVDGTEVVQLYISDKKASVERELKSLKGFKRVSLKAGESKTVSLKIDKSALEFYDVKSESWVVEPGKFEVLVGNSSRNILLLDTFKIK